MMGKRRIARRLLKFYRLAHGFPFEDMKLCQCRVCRFVDKLKLV